MGLKLWSTEWEAEEMMSKYGTASVIAREDLEEPKYIMIRTSGSFIMTGFHQSGQAVVLGSEILDEGTVGKRFIGLLRSQLPEAVNNVRSVTLTAKESLVPCLQGEQRYEGLYLHASSLLSFTPKIKTTRLHGKAVKRTLRSTRERLSGKSDIALKDCWVDTDDEM